jgi:hypothetical protein
MRARIYSLLFLSGPKMRKKFGSSRFQVLQHRKSDRRWLSPVKRRVLVSKLTRLGKMGMVVNLAEPCYS